MTRPQVEQFGWPPGGKGRSMLTWMWVVAVLSFLLNVLWVHRNATATFYSPLPRMWELAAGALMAWRALRLEPHRNVLRRELRSVSGLVLIALGLLLINASKAFPGFWALLPVVGACLCISAGPGAWLNDRLLGSRPMVWVGLISYPLYLWHWPLLSFARIIEGGPPSPWVRGLLAMIAVVLAWATYKLLESRFRAAPRRTPAMVGSLVALMIVISGVGWATYANDGLKFRGQIRETNAVNAQLVGWNWPHIKNDRCLKKYPFQGSEAYGYWFCMASSDEKPTLLVLGNSHANHLYPGIANNQMFRKQSVLSIGNCDAGWVQKSELSPEVTIDTCTGYRMLDQMELINGIVSNSHSVKFVIIAGWSFQYQNSSYIEKLKRRVDFLESQGAKVILFVPHVWLTYNPRACFSRPFAKPKESCELPVDAYRKKLSDFNKIAQAITATNPSVRVFDQNVLFCDEATCSFKKYGMPLMRDEYGHLSEYGSNQMAALFAEWARTNAPDLLAN